MSNKPATLSHVQNWLFPFVTYLCYIVSFGIYLVNIFQRDPRNIQYNHPQTGARQLLLKLVL